MGAGASSGLGETVTKASDEEIYTAVAALPDADRARLKDALQAANATEKKESGSSNGSYKPGPPVASVVAAGNCVFGAEWTSCSLVSKVNVSHDSRLFTFSLPDESKALGLSTCACILAKAPAGDVKDGDGADVIRPYTPVSTNALIGKFELLVKVYPEGKLSQYLDKMEIGNPVEFKHIDKNVKMQFPFKPKIGMIVGGTGITPMIQALHAVLGTEGDTSSVSMLYGSRTADDILGRETLDEWSGLHKRFTVTHVLSNEAEGSSWDGLRGFVTKDLIEKHFPAPSEDCIIFVCGPPPMYNAFCGARDAAELTGALADLGYKAEQVFKF